VSRFTLILHARNGQSFSQESFNNLVGDHVEIKKDFGGSYAGELIEATVTENTQHVHLVLEIPDAPSDG
jgi:hypothetical protein